MSRKTQEVEELVVKNGGHDDDHPSAKGYPRDYPKDYPKDKYDAPDYPRDYPKDYPRDKYDAPDYPQEYSKDYPFKGYRKGVFETPIPVRGLFDGEIWAAVYERGGISPTNVIRIDQSWGVIVKWKTSGCLARMICGKWRLQLCLESIGPGLEMRLPAEPKCVDLEPCSGKDDSHTIYYKCHIEIPPGTVTADHCSIPYKLVTTLTYLEPCGTPGPIAAYVEGQILQFFKP